jgi:hypothetical protein
LARHACRANSDFSRSAVVPRVRLIFSSALAYFTLQAFTVRAEKLRNDKRLQT